MAAPSFQKVSPPPPKRTEPNWAVAEAKCKMPSQFAYDAWIEGLRVWGVEANWGAAWFDQQFKNSHPQLVCHLSPGQKFYWLLTELQAQPQGAQLYAAFNSGWQKVIADNAKNLDPAGCNGHRGRPLDKAKVDDALICPAGGGAGTKSGTAIIEPAAQAQQMAPAQLTPAAKAKQDAAEKKAAEEKAKKEAVSCRPEALWRTWFYGEGLGDAWKFDPGMRDSTNNRLKQLGVNASKPGAVVALMSGESVNGQTLDTIFPTGGWFTGHESTKKTTDKEGWEVTTTTKEKFLYPRPYGAATWSEAIKKAYVDPDLAPNFAHCPTSLDKSDTGASATESIGLDANMATIAMIALAAWAVLR